jgi:hypothetical protein
LKLPYLLAAFVSHLAKQAEGNSAEVLADAAAAVEVSTNGTGELEYEQLCTILRLLKWCCVTLPKLVRLRRDAESVLAQHEGTKQRSKAAAELRASLSMMHAVKSEMAAADFPHH